MSNFKSGSGNLDFGGGNDEETSEQKSSEEPSQSTTERSANPATTSTDTTDTEGSPDASSSNSQSTKSDSPVEMYPYFVRRSNVGDERDTRLEIHVRDKVAEQEGKFRSELAEQLGSNEVSKTDAREFALLAAFQNPEKVAELMREEGFGTLD